MEKIGAKKMMMVMSLMVLMMVALAQELPGESVVAADIHQLLINPPPPGGGGQRTKHCAKKCGFKCMFCLIPSRIAAFFGLRMLRCELLPPAAIFNCTCGCANSMVNAYNPTDAEKVGSFIGSCYKTCKQNAKN